LSEVLLGIVDKNTKKVVHAQIMSLNSTKTINLREGLYSIYACAEGYVTSKVDVAVSEHTSVTTTISKGAPRFDDLKFKVGTSFNANLKSEIQPYQELKLKASTPFNANLKSEMQPYQELKFKTGISLSGDPNEFNSELTIELSATEG